MNYLLFLFITFYNISYETEKVDLKVIVTNVKTLKGNVDIGIFNDEKSFLLKGKEFRTSTTVVKNDTVIFILKDLVKGHYAVSIYHDVNGDNECNVNFLGIPKEPYGFSNNFKPKMSRPSFEDCKIDMNSDKSIMIKLLN